VEAATRDLAGTHSHRSRDRSEAGRGCVTLAPDDGGPPQRWLDFGLLPRRRTRRSARRRTSPVNPKRSPITCAPASRCARSWASP
jgi:hypothetical protein